MLKKFSIAFIIYIIIAFPTFYLISGEINQDMILRSGIGFIVAVLVIYFLSPKKRK
jgi:hypothetical protein